MSERFKLALESARVGSELGYVPLEMFRHDFVEQFRDVELSRLSELEQLLRLSPRTEATGFVEAERLRKALSAPAK